LNIPALVADPNNKVTPNQKILYDVVQDVDSRDSWGGFSALNRAQAAVPGGGTGGGGGGGGGP